MNKDDLTFGERACSVSFNPDGNTEVTYLKDLYAYLVDAFNNRRNHTNNAEVKRMYSVAITELQTSQMWAVKAVTWNL